MSSSSSPCAACKFLRRKCTQECVFAPYFPPDQPQKFSTVHKVFGASNVAKILNELTPSQREDAVNSLAYEADARLRDPVYGCVGHISILQTRLKQVQHDLLNAKKELATYIGPSAMLSLLPQIGLMQQHMGYNNMVPMLSGHAFNPQQLMMEVQQQQQMAAMVAAREQQEMMRGYEQQQQQQQKQEMARFSEGFDLQPRMPAANVVSSSLALGSSGDVSYQVNESQPEHSRIPHHHQLQLHSQPQLLLHQQLNHQEEGSVVGHS